MRILIGIMYCIENEFSDCIKAIKSQTHTDYEYFIIKNLTNKLAHETLYKTFMQRATGFDLFIKIDADMVLNRNTVFDEIVKVFQQNANLQLLKTQLHDFFTDNLIGSLNIFRSNVKWLTESDAIFPDRFEQAIVWSDDVFGLSPVADHCPNPSDFQAFHFGVHKAVKVMQLGKKNKNYGASCEHWNNIEQTKENYSNKNDKRLAFAVLGAEIAFKKRFSYKEVDFENPTLVKTFNKHKNKSFAEIKRFINRFRLSSYTFLPSKLRQDMLFRFQSQNQIISCLQTIPYLLKMGYYNFKIKIVKI